jgi:hypothetical protein
MMKKILSVNDVVVSFGELRLKIKKIEIWHVSITNEITNEI